MGAGRPSIAVALLGCALALAAVPASASAATVGKQGHGALSPRLAELVKPSVRSLSRGAQARVLGLPRTGPGSLRRVGGRVLVEARFDHGAVAGVEALRAAGAKIVSVSRRYQAVTASVSAGDLHGVASVGHVSYVKEVLTPLLFGEPCRSGEIVSKGDAQLRAEKAREEFAVDGSEVTVGILSDSFDQAASAATHAPEDIASADLPGSGNPCGDATEVNVIEPFVPQGKTASEEEEELEQLADEGRAMAQIVHDLAPGAALDFASAFNGETSFAKNVEELANAGAKVIADDVSYFEEPFFQEGPVGVAVSNVTASGVSYFSAAGNDNLSDGAGRDIGSWETPKYRDSGGCPAALVNLSAAIEAEEGPGMGLHPTHCLDFNPGTGTDRTFGITVQAGATLIVDLQWAEAWEAVGTDLDAFLFNSEGSLLGYGADDNVSKTKRPFELAGWENTTGASQQVQLVINRYGGLSPRLKFALLQNGGGVSAIEYPESSGGDVVGPTIFGHSGGEDAMSVGAIRFNTTEEPELFSSRGPVTHYFGPVAGVVPAAPLPSAQVLSKPDVVATDCGVTTFFYIFKTFPPEGEPAWHFCGTSAAAPHAAAIAALMLQAHPSARPEEIQSMLRASAVPVGSFGRPCAIGAGMVDAVAALEAFSTSILISGAKCTPPASPPILEEVEEEVKAANPPATPSSAALPPPNTFIRIHPRKLIRTRRRRAKAVFAFTSDQGGVTFVCRIDKGAFRSCPARLVKRFKAGRHSVRVAAVDAAGNADPTPAVFRFRVKLIG